MGKAAKVEQAPFVIAGVPKAPGWYNWSAWGDARVKVFKKRGGRYLYVVPPGPHKAEVKITPRIAGNFKVSENQNDEG